MSEAIDFYINMLAGSTSGLAAVSGLKSLDDAAARTTGKIKELEAAQAKASGALEAIKAPESLKKLEAQLEAVTKAKSNAFARGDIAQLSKLGKDKVALEEKVGKAREAASAKAAKQEETIAKIAAKVAGAKGDQASNANLLAAKRGMIVKGLDEQVSKLGQLANAAREAGIPGAGLVGKLQMLAKAGPAAAVAALAVALVAVAAAGIVAAVALTRYAFASADAARSSALLSVAAAGSGSAGWELERVVSQLSDKIPIAREKTAEWARELALAGFAGRDMQRTLTTMGTVAAAVGDAAAGKIRGIAEASRMAQKLMLGARDRFGEFASLQGTGVKAADIYAAVAKSMKTSIPEAERMVKAGIVPFRKGLEALELAAETKLGPIVAKQMMSLKVQGEKLKENLAGLFSGVNIETFLAGLKSITDLFSESSVLGYTLRQVFGSFFTDLSDKSGAIFPLIRAAIYGVAFAVIVLMTWGKRLANTISEAFGNKLDGIDKAKTAFMLGAAAVGALVGALLFVPIVLAAIATSIAILTIPLWLPFVLGALAIYGMVKAFEAIKEKITSLVDAVKSVDLSAAAGNIMDSLINGIKAKIADVKAAITDVASAITGAFDSKMEIKSPSKVMTRRANWVVDPLVTVPEQREGEVRAAIGGLGGLDRPSETSGSAKGQGFGEPGITFNNCTFGGDPEAFRQIIREERRAFFLGEARGSALATT
jgi:hypothetical protein